MAAATNYACRIRTTTLTEPAAPDEEPAPPDQPRPSRLSALRSAGSAWTGLVVVVYAVLAVVAFLPQLPWDNSHLLVTAPNDSTDVGWFLAWGSYATSHLHNPFFTDWMEFPTGINIPANQSMPLLGVVSTPLALLFGSFGMVNFTMRLSFLASALAMYWTLRHFCDRRLSAFVGGLFFGFSPFLVAHNLENQNFSFLPALPIIFLFAYRLVNGESPSLRRDGVGLGVALAVQLYLNPEPCAEILVVLALTSVVVLAYRALRRRPVGLARLARGLAVAFGVFVVLGLPFIYYYLAGPQHTTGTVVGTQYLANDHGDLAQLVFPDRNQLIGPTSDAAVANQFTTGAVNEAGSYLGVTMLLAMVVFSVALRRVRAVAFSVIAFLVALVFSLGPDLYVYNHDTGIPMPARLLLHLPVLSSAETVRYFVVGDVAVAVILAVGVDRLLGGAWDPWPLKRLRGRGPAAVLAAVVVLLVVVLFPLVPRWPYTSAPLGIPSYFTSSQVDAIAPGATVLSYPIAQSGAVEAMQWQMAADFRFKIVSGYGYVADDGGQTLGNPPFVPPALAQLENVASGNDTSDQIPPLTLRDLLRIRRGLAYFRVDDFVMVPVGLHPSTVERYLELALGEAPESVGGVLVWYDVPARLKLSLHDALLDARRAGLISSYPPVGQ